ncbi:MAG: hypothetical protein QNJ57_04280 [Flavobacteriaceae bacterium]|nr:hypothetical protein [Flavobacteriaceae bacterium]
MKRLLLLLLVAPLLASATDCPDYNCNLDHKYKYEKSKTIKKEFNVNSDALLKINNRYGNVDVSSWNENRVVIDVNITVSGNNEDKVIKRLEMIDVDFDSSNSLVSAKTVIEKKSSNWKWGWGRKSNVNYKINYKVKVPVTNSVDLMNDYGSIYLNEIKGDAAINCDYGKIEIGELHSTNNRINLDYCSPSVISKMSGGSINSDYSKFTVEEAGNIRLVADYSTSVFEQLNNIDYNCDYGSLKVNNARIVEGNGDYLTARLGSVSQRINIKADYGSFKVTELKPGFESVNLDSEYCGMEIGVPDAPFDFELKLGYGRFKRDDGKYEISKQIVKSSSKYYDGYHKSKNSGSRITVNSDYGSVTFY